MVAVVCLVIATTFSGRPSILTVFGGSFNLTNKMVKDHLALGPFVVCQLTHLPQHPCYATFSGSLCFNMTGRPTQRVIFQQHAYWKKLEVVPTKPLQVG